ncbi:MAG: ECF-type sigma factor [Planctomycetota bacterium]
MIARHSPTRDACTLSHSDNAAEVPRDDQATVHCEPDMETAVYAELRRVAQSILRGFPPGQTLSATALVNEAITRLAASRYREWDDQRRVVATMVVTMRRLLVDTARRREVQRKAFGALARQKSAAAADAGRSVDSSAKLVCIDAALHKLRRIDSRAHAVVELKYFGGLSMQQISTQLGLSERTVGRDWAFAKAWLVEELRSQRMS